MLAPAIVACGERQTELAAANQAQNSVAWFGGTLDAAFQKAKSLDKPVMVYWSAEWCPYCKALDATVFTRPDFIAQSRQVIAVTLNGDLPESQRWGQKFKVVGYPTLLIFRPDGTEISRVSGGMDLEQYATTLARVISDRRPIAEILADESLTPEGCRRLAWHGWDLEADADVPSPERANQLAAAAARCPPAESTAPARLSTRALAYGLLNESEALQQGKPPSQTLVDEVRAMLPVLNDPRSVRGVADILVSFDDAIYLAVKSQGPEFAEDFRLAWSRALLAASEDSVYGESEQLLSLAIALDGEKQLSPDQAVDPERAALARKRVAAAISHGGQSGSRHDIVNAARIIYTVLGDDQALYDLLIREIPKSATPYYYMPALAGIEERRGRPAEALQWLKQAYEATRTPGARARWGSGYVRGLIRMTPDDLATIEKASLEVAAVIRERDPKIEKTPDRKSSFEEALEKWATTPERAAVLEEARQVLTS